MINVDDSDGPTIEFKFRVRLPLTTADVLACVVLFVQPSRDGSRGDEIHVSMSTETPNALANPEVRSAAAELLQGVAVQLLADVPKN